MEINKEAKLKKLREKVEQNKGKEYRLLYARISFALVKDGHLSRIGSNAFAVYLVIFSHKDRDSVAYPSLNTIKRFSGLSINTVRKSIKELEKRGWIKRKELARKKDGTFENTRYEALQTDLIRGSESKGFADKPISNYDNGIEV